MGWTTVNERPGYFGKRREQRLVEYDERFGAGRWRLAWQIGEVTGGQDQALMAYEDAYYAYLLARPDMLELLAREARDVFDDAPSNVRSGLDYFAQETNLNHLHDIAIRRCMVRLGRAFQGERLIQIRHVLGDHPLSLLLSPSQVPFHRPEWIIHPELERWWWQPGSIESFYQSNKLLQRLV